MRSRGGGRWLPIRSGRRVRTNCPCGPKCPNIPALPKGWQRSRNWRASSRPGTADSASRAAAASGPSRSPSMRRGRRRHLHLRRARQAGRRSRPGEAVLVEFGRGRQALGVVAGPGGRSRLRWTRSRSWRGFGPTARFFRRSRSRSHAGSRRNTWRRRPRCFVRCCRQGCSSGWNWSPSCCRCRMGLAARQARAIGPKTPVPAPKTAAPAPKRHCSNAWPKGRERSATWTAVTGERRRCGGCARCRRGGWSGWSGHSRRPPSGLVTSAG